MVSLAISNASSSSSNGNDREHRAEHLLAGDAHRVGDLGEDGRLDEPAAGPASGAAGRLPPSTQRAPSLRRHLDVVEHLLALRQGRDRADLGGSVHRVAELARTRRKAHDLLDDTSSWTERWTSRREPAMQVWPVAAKMPEIAPFTAASRSASAKTMFGDLPPSSSVTRLMPPAAAA